METPNKKLKALSICLILVFLILPSASCLRKNAEVSQEKVPENLTQIQTNLNNSQQKQTKDSPAVTPEKTFDKIKAQFACSPQQLRKVDIL